MGGGAGSGRAGAPVEGWSKPGLRPPAGRGPASCTVPLFDDNGAIRYATEASYERESDVLPIDAPDQYRSGECHGVRAALIKVLRNDAGTRAGPGL